MPDPSFILRKHQHDVCCVKFMNISDQNDILASADVMGDVKVWNLQTRRPIHEFRPSIPKCSIPNIEYNSTIKPSIITQTRSPTHGWIHGWDINKLSDNNPKPIFKFDTFCSSFCKFQTIQHLNYEIYKKSNINLNNLDNSVIKPFTNDNNNNIPNPNESLLAKALRTHNQSVPINNNNDIKNNDDNILSDNINSSSLLIATCGHSRALLEIWDAHNSKLIHKLDFDSLSKLICSDISPRGMIMSVNGFYSNKRNDILIVIMSESGIIDIYDVRASKILITKKFGINTPLTAMSLNNKKNRGICAGTNKSLYGFQIKYSKQIIKLKKEIKLKNDGVNILKIRNYDQKIFGIGGWDHRTRIYNWNTFKPLCILKGHKGAITDIDFHPNSNLLATSSKDAKVNVYELY